MQIEIKTKHGTAVVVTNQAKISSDALKHLVREVLEFEPQPKEPNQYGTR